MDMQADSKIESEPHVCRDADLARDPGDDRTAKLKIAHGIMWCLIWLGFGGCCWLVSH
jgi:hypothetical protein